VIRGDPETVIYNLMRDGFSDLSYLDAVRASEDDVNGFAERGARIVQQHPLYPCGLFAKSRRYRGCPALPCRGLAPSGTEALNGPPDTAPSKG